MPRIVFTENIQRHVPCPVQEVPGGTVREVLEAAFRENPRARGYVLEDDGALRRHMAVFVDGRLVDDPRGLGDVVEPDSEIYVMQALSGG